MVDLNPILEAELAAIPRRVEAGMNWNDQHDPGWEKLVDLNDLDMGSCVSCVRGQIYHGRHPENLDPQSEEVRYPFLCDARETGLTRRQETEYGFNNNSDDDAPVMTPAYHKAYFAALTVEWRRRITARTAPEPKMTPSGMILSAHRPDVGELTVRPGMRVCLRGELYGRVHSYTDTGVVVMLDRPPRASLPFGGTDNEGASVVCEVAAVNAGHFDIEAVIPDATQA